MKFGNREKIIGVSVVALGLIGGLHFLVFAPKANQYQESVKAYNDAVADLNNVGQPPPETEIVSFQQRTWDYQRRMLDFLKDANLLIPEGFPIPVVVEKAAPVEGEEGYDYYAEEQDPAAAGIGAMGMMGPWMGGPGMMGAGQGSNVAAIPEKEFDPLTPEQKRTLAAKLSELERLRDAGGDTRLTFMDGETQWNILRQLPDAIRRGNVDVADLVRRLQGTDAIIKQAGEGSNLRYQRQGQYVTELRGIGLDQVRRQGLAPGGTPNTLVNSRAVPSILRDYGNLAAVMHTINRINLIKASVPKESLNITSDEAYFAQLEDLLRLDSENEQFRTSDITYIKWQVVAFDALKQMDALLDLITMARDAKLVEVSSVKFWDPVDVEWIDPATAATADATTTDGAAAGAMNPWGDPSMMGMGDPTLMDPSMMMGMGMGMGFGMGFGMQPVGPTGEVIGTSTPIEIEVRGTNAAVMAFAHAITHSRRLYSIDSFQITGVTGQPNIEVTARMVVHVMSRLKNPRFQMTETQFNERLAAMEQGSGVASASTPVDTPMDTAVETPGLVTP
jgi:hypothetical protein